jgi:L-threonylcarbamoyladenylate synthase
MKPIKNLLKEIKNGKIFIYPTDTIYGIGCNAENIEAVEKIKEIKLRDKDKPLSLIAPNFEWINNNMIVDCDLKKYLPGPYTLILKKKDPNFLSHVSNTDSIGIRIPDNDFTRELQESNLPFITTSVNLSGEPFITKISDINPDILESVNHIIDYGELNGRPSTIIINGKEIKR